MRKLNDGLSICADISFLQAILLLQFSMLFSGTKQGVLNLQYQRNLLITLLRPITSHHGSIFWRCEPISDMGDAQWHRWIKRESWIRLLYFTWCKFSECDLHARLI